MINFTLNDFDIVENMFESFGYFDESGNLVSYIRFEQNTSPNISYIDFTDGQAIGTFFQRTEYILHQERPDGGAGLIAALDHSTVQQVRILEM